MAASNLTHICMGENGTGWTGGRKTDKERFAGIVS